MYTVNEGNDLDNKGRKHHKPILLPEASPYNNGNQPVTF